MSSSYLDAQKEVDRLNAENAALTLRLGESLHKTDVRALMAEAWLAGFKGGRGTWNLDDETAEVAADDARIWASGHTLCAVEGQRDIDGAKLPHIQIIDEFASVEGRAPTENEGEQ